MRCRRDAPESSTEAGPQHGQGLPDGATLSKRGAWGQRRKEPLAVERTCVSDNPTRGTINAPSLLSMLQCCTFQVVDSRKLSGAAAVACRSGLDALEKPPIRPGRHPVEWIVREDSLSDGCFDGLVSAQARQPPYIVRVLTQGAWAA